MKPAQTVNAAARPQHIHTTHTSTLHSLLMTDQPTDHSQCGTY